MTTEIWMWILFHVFVVAMLALDLGVFHRTAHQVRVREALAWSGVWIVLALVFAGLVYTWKDGDLALQFLTGYVIEKSLSVDNLFVFLLVFHYFKVPAQDQHRVLFWGIVGAMVMRAVFILAGVALITKFHWIIYVFGLFLIYSGVKIALEKDKEIHPEQNPVLRLFRRLAPTTPDYVGHSMFLRIDGQLFDTPLFLVLLVIETTDVIFAVDSIPAILAISRDPFIVYTSNIFAILGLRSLYFALAGMMAAFHYLHYGLAFVLVFVGTKMLISETEYKLHTGVTLAVVCGVLALSVILSLLFPGEQKEELPAIAPEIPEASSTPTPVDSESQSPS